MSSSRGLEIKSHKGNYLLHAENGIAARLWKTPAARSFFLVDRKVAELYGEALTPVLKTGRCLLIEATEENKTLDRFTFHIEKVAALGARRGDTLVAIGGGVIQDITCFIAATLFRGIAWEFFPTTLLAQADSGIGSKSSINVGDTKNLLGTFTPPQKVWVDPELLHSLPHSEVMSGVGEILKINIIDGSKSFAAIAAKYDSLFESPAAMLEAIFGSLEIKKRFIEEDEFDRGIRNVLNYGHSFGHAIESATRFAIPHGIAVSIGMDLANFVSVGLGLCGQEHFLRMHPALKKNFKGFERTPVPREAFFAGLGKDKKNSATELGLILLDSQGVPCKKMIKRTQAFDDLCVKYLEEVRA